MRKFDSLTFRCRNRRHACVYGAHVTESARSRGRRAPKSAPSSLGALQVAGGRAAIFRSGGRTKQTDSGGRGKSIENGNTCGEGQVRPVARVHAVGEHRPATLPGAVRQDAAVPGVRLRLVQALLRDGLPVSQEQAGQRVGRCGRARQERLRQRPGHVDATRQQGARRPVHHHPQNHASAHPQGATHQTLQIQGWRPCVPKYNCDYKAPGRIYFQSPRLSC